MINNVTLMGRITQSLELNKTPAGTSVLRFQIAVDRRFSNSTEKVTDFLDCVAWNKTADFISIYFKKGDMIAVIGEVQTREYETRDKTKKKAVEIVVSNASFCGGKSNANASDEQPAPVADANASDEQTAPVTVIDDDLPF